MLMEVDLPEDVEALRALALAQSRMLATELAAKADLATAKSEADAEIERLQSILDAFMRHRFGRKSEQLDPDQLQLGLEDVETALGEARAAREATAAKPKDSSRRKSNRGALPAHLERIEQVTYKNPLAAYGQSGQISEQDWEGSEGIDPTALFEGNTLLRGGMDVATAMSQYLMIE